MTEAIYPLKDILQRLVGQTDEIIFELAFELAELRDMCAEVFNPILHEAAFASSIGTPEHQQAIERLQTYLLEMADDDYSALRLVFMLVGLLSELIKLETNVQLISEQVSVAGESEDDEEKEIIDYFTKLLARLEQHPEMATVFAWRDYIDPLLHKARDVILVSPLDETEDSE